MDNKSFEKEIAELNAEIKNRGAYRDKLLDEKYSASQITPQQYARYSRLKGKLERIEEDIARIEED